MNISPNIIRFPSPAFVTERSAESRAKPDNVVAFPEAQSEVGLSADAQAHGQMFAAERIVARVADQLDAISTL
jgi:hypothetical protein